MSAARFRAKLLERVIEAPSGCWEWVGYRGADHYGKYSGGQNSGWPVPAHRAMYFAMVGPVSRHLDLDHLCRNRACVNPKHLQPVTRQVNNLRSGNFSGVNSRKTNCPAGHPYKGEHLRIVNGRRECYTCRRQRAGIRLAEIRAARVPKPPRTHCGNGHELTAENVRYVNGDPKQPQCRPCQRVRSGAYKARKRLERQQSAS